MLRTSLLPVLLVSLSACSSIGVSETQQLAYQGKGPNPCLFGGTTPAADWHCLVTAKGYAGALSAVNARLMQELAQADGDRSCQAHVDRVRAALWERPDLRVFSVFSCPRGYENCHVSALVGVPGGQYYVLDNGTVIKSQQHLASVAPFKDFRAAVGNEYWFHPPVMRAVAEPSVATPPAGLSDGEMTAPPGELRRRR